MSRMVTNSLYTWIKFNLYDIQDVAMNSNALIALHDGSQKVLILSISSTDFTEDDLAADMVAFIVNQFEDIKQIKWVYNEDLLFVVDKTGTHIWDPYQNQPVLTRSNTNTLQFVRRFPEATIFGHLDGSLQVIYDDRERVTPKRDGFVWQNQNEIVNFPFRYYFDKGSIEIANANQSRIDKRVARNFRNVNDVSNIQLFSNFSDSNQTINLQLPENHFYKFEQSKVIRVLQFHPFLLIQVPDGMLVQLVDGESNFYLKGSFTDCSLIGHQALLIQTHSEDYLVLQRENSIYAERLRYLMNEVNFIIGNGPNSLFVNQNPNLTYSKFDLQRGFAWLADYEKDHVFLDLFTSDMKFFPNTTHLKNVNVFIETGGSFLVEWLKGGRYPDGTLTYYPLTDDENDVVKIYDHHEEISLLKTSYHSSKESDLETDISDDDINHLYSLIIPEWTSMKIQLRYENYRESVTISKSAAYLMMNTLTRISNSKDFIFFKPEIFPDSNFILFGDFKLKTKRKTIEFMGISPIAAYHPETNIFASYSFDKHLYIWHTDNQLPIYNKPMSFPIMINFTGSGDFLVLISFDMKVDSLIANPKIQHNGNRTNLNSLFPRIEVTIIELATFTVHSKSHRFPTHLQKTNAEISIQERSDTVLIVFPSYVDNRSNYELVFNKTNKVFSIKSQSNLRRFWQTHSRNLLSKMTRGEEFPVELHPEIKRDYRLRDFEMMNQEVFAKKNGFLIASAKFDNTVFPQIATDDFFNLTDKASFRFPFYANKAREIFLTPEYTEYLQGKNLVELFPPSEIPDFYSIKLEDFINDRSIRARLAKFIKYLLRKQIHHTENGIAYKVKELDQDYKTYLEGVLSQISKTEIVLNVEKS